MDILLYLPTDIGKRVLIKDQTNSAYNGVYTVTNVGSGSTAWVLTRATDFDSTGSGVDQIDAGDFFLVTAGATLANTSWVQQTPLPITIGTTAIVFTEFGAPITYSAGTGLDLNGTVFSLETPVTIANGGTGQTSANAALNALLPAQTNNTFLKSNGYKYKLCFVTYFFTYCNSCRTNCTNSCGKWIFYCFTQQRSYLC
jgi:hypothetical protein